jgi:predicted MFS family arabinose efflux permease
MMKRGNWWPGLTSKVSKGRLAVVGLCGSLAAFGFGRFAYTALLPPMQSDLRLSYSTAGWLASANLIAYLVGAMAAGSLTRRVGPRMLLMVAMSAICIPLFGLWLSAAYATLVAFMVLLGFLGALLWIAVIAMLTGPSVPSAQRGGLVGLTALGSGGGIPVVAALVTGLRIDQDPARWRVAWLAMGLISVALAVVTLWVVHAGADHSANVALEPGAQHRSVLDDAHRPTARRIWLIYGMYGFGYSIFVTFAVAFLRLHVSSGASLGIWALLGLSAGIGGLLIGQGSDRWGRVPILALSLTVTAVAAGLPIWTSSPPAVLVSVTVFGFPMVGVGSVVAAYLGDLFSDAARSGSMFATATVLFGVGQGAGPAVAGPLIDSTGSFTAPFIMSSVTLVAAALVASRLPRARTGSQGATCTS